MLQEIELEQKKHEVNQANSVAEVVNAVSGNEQGSDRGRFIIKVYSLLTVMLAVTTMTAALVYKSETAKKWMFSNQWLLWVCVALVLVVMCSICCCWKVFRKFPLNYVLLAVYTLCHSVMVAAIVPMYEPGTIIGAAACTMSMFLGLTALACKMKVNITFIAGIITTLFTTIITLVIVNFLVRSKIVDMCIIGVCIVLLSVYMIFDTKLIIGGKHKRVGEDCLDEQDYIIGAMILYSDIITMFLYVLELMGNSN